MAFSLHSSGVAGRGDSSGEFATAIDQLEHEQRTAGVYGQEPDFAMMRRMERINTALAACEDVITVLSGQLRTARELRARLEAGLPPDAAAVGLCEDLWNGAIGSARAIVALQEQVCEEDAKPLPSGRRSRRS